MLLVGFSAFWICELFYSASYALRIQEVLVWISVAGDMLITWLKSRSTPAVLWLIWVLVMRRAQRTGAKRLTFFKSTTQGIATYQKFTPAPASVHCKRWPQTYYSCQQKTLRVLNAFSRKSLFSFFLFSSKALFLLLTSAGLGVLIYGTNRKNVMRWEC